MPELRAAEVARVTGGRVIGDPDARADGFGADSRGIPAGAGFIAIRGGHAYVAEAMSAGAGLAVVEREDALPAGTPGVVVADVEAALAALASEVRGRLKARVLAVTGSTGKTLTKDFLTAALGARFVVHSAPGSYNNEVGLPLTILSCPQEAEALVVELGARHPGDVAALAAIAAPNVGVITGIGLTHLEVFGSREAIAHTKAELLEALPADGLAVLPAGDDFLDVLASSTRARVVTVGPGGAIRPVDVWLDDEGRANGSVAMPDGRTVRLRLPVPGRHLVRNATLALAAAAALGVDPDDAADAMGDLSPAGLARWRMQIAQSGERTVVNDAYNANPTSVAAALKTAREMANGRPVWAVLGVMAELGPIAEREHRRVGRLAASLGYERVVCVGQGVDAVAEGARNLATRIAGTEEAAAYVLREAPRDAVILVKGSRVAKLDELASRLLASAQGGPEVRV